MTQPLVRVEICGGIASGKTTLARRLTENLAGSLVLEDFRSNPFWRRFYQDPNLFFREKNICFLAQHVGEIKAVRRSPIICDFAVVQDLAYASMSNEAEHMAAMDHIYEHLYAPIVAPRLVVHLVCDESIQLKRIRQRGRPEEDSITLEYLRQLNEALASSVESILPASSIFEVRSDEVNFASDTPKSKALMQRLQDLVAVR